MSNQQTVEEFRLAVKQDILNDGVHIRGKSAACDCEQCKLEGKIQPTVFTSILDGYVHSIGFHEKGKPEILILVGPNGTDELELTKEQLNDRIRNADLFIGNIDHNGNDFIFDKNKAYNSFDIEGLYWVIIEDDDGQMQEYVKHELMDATTAYYYDCQYEVIIFKAHIR